MIISSAWIVYQVSSEDWSTLQEEMSWDSAFLDCFPFNPVF